MAAQEEVVEEEELGGAAGAHLRQQHSKSPAQPANWCESCMFVCVRERVCNMGRGGGGG